MPGQVDEERCA